MEIKVLKFFVLFLIIIWGCNNAKPKLPNDALVGEVISVCQDSVLTREVDGKYYRKIILKFKVSNHSNLTYHTRLFDSKISADKITEYFITNDSISHTNMHCFDHEKDSILPNSSQIFINTTTPFKLRKWIKKSFFFYANNSGSVQKSKEVIISFNPNKMINCK
jgi:hypothetical protein